MNSPKENTHTSLIYNIMWDIVCPLYIFDQYHQPRNTIDPKIVYYNLTKKDWKSVKKLPKALFVQYKTGTHPNTITKIIENHYGWYTLGITWASAIFEAGKEAKEHNVKTAYIRNNTLVWK